MEKRVWTMPRVEVEQFEMSQYIAACGDENRVYKFVCDADGGPLTDDQGHYNRANYSPCGDTHEALVDSVFTTGYVDYNNNRRRESNEEVIVWLETNRWGQIVNGHATKNLDMDSWETAKS